MIWMFVLPAPQTCPRKIFGNARRHGRSQAHADTLRRVLATLLDALRRFPPPPRATQRPPGLRTQELVESVLKDGPDCADGDLWKELLGQVHKGPRAAAGA